MDSNLLQKHVYNKFTGFSYSSWSYFIKYVFVDRFGLKIKLELFDFIKTSEKIYWL